jgi:hypothetical protein
VDAAVGVGMIRAFPVPAFAKEAEAKASKQVTE